MERQRKAVGEIKRRGGGASRDWEIEGDGGK